MQQDLSPRRLHMKVVWTDLEPELLLAGCVGVASPFLEGMVKNHSLRHLQHIMAFKLAFKHVWLALAVSRFGVEDLRGQSGTQGLGICDKTPRVQAKLCLVLQV